MSTKHAALSRQVAIAPEVAAILTPEVAAEVPVGEVLTREEANAIIEDRVARETTRLNERVAAMTAEAASAKDVADARLATEVARAEAAERALADFRAEIAEAAERETRETARREAVSALAGVPEGYVTDERAARWASLSDEQWASQLADLTDAFAAAPAKQPAEPAATYSRTTPLAPPAGGSNKESVVWSFAKTIAEKV